MKEESRGEEEEGTSQNNLSLENSKGSIDMIREVVNQLGLGKNQSLGPRVEEKGRGVLTLTGGADTCVPA